MPDKRTRGRNGCMDPIGESRKVSRVLSARNDPLVRGIGAMQLEEVGVIMGQDGTMIRGRVGKNFCTETPNPARPAS